MKKLKIGLCILGVCVIAAGGIVYGVYEGDKKEASLSKSSDEAKESASLSREEYMDTVGELGDNEVRHVKKVLVDGSGIESIDELADEAEIVVRGRISERIGSFISPYMKKEEFDKIDDSLKSNFTSVKTVYKIEISDYIKGDYTEDTIEYTVTGGVYGDVEYKIGMGLPEVGKEYLFFLSELDEYGNRFGVDLFHGRYELLETEAGEDKDLAELYGTQRDPNSSFAQWKTVKDVKETFKEKSSKEQ